MEKSIAVIGSASVQEQEIELALVQKKAEIVLKSRLIPSSLDSVEKIIVVLLRAAELGIPQMEAVSNLYVVNQKVAINSQEMLAMIYRSKELEEIDIGNDGQKAWCVMKRKGNKSPYRAEFSIEDGRKASLLTKDNWMKYPMAMCEARAISAAARKVCPDIIGGMYMPEELENVSQEVAGTVIDSATGKVETPKIRSVKVTQSGSKPTVDTPTKPVAEDASVVETAPEQKPASIPATTPTPPPAPAAVPDKYAGMDPEKVKLLIEIEEISKKAGLTTKMLNSYIATNFGTTIKKFSELDNAQLKDVRDDFQSFLDAK